MINLIIKFMNERLSEKQRQWAWFIILWCFGLGCVMTLGALIKLVMNI